MGFFFGLIFAIFFLIVLINFPKQTLSAIGVLIVGVLILWYAFVTIPEQKREYAENKVKIFVTYNATACSPEYPLSIIIINNSGKTLNKAEWRLGAYRTGYSSNLIGYGNDYSSDKIIKSGESWSACYNIPKNLLSIGYGLDKLEYKVEYKYLNFD